MQAQDLHTKILKRLKPFSDKKRAEFSVGYMNTSFDILGCNIPSIRKIAREILTDLERNYTQSELRRIMANLWKFSNNFEALHIPLWFFSEKEDLNLADWRILKSWAGKIDNWAHSDWLSSIYATLLEAYPKEIYPVFTLWNQDRNPWKRRLSLTSLLYYSNSRKTILSVMKILPLIKARLHDDNPYVQKAVGWTLRECGNVYPEKTKDFIKMHILDLSSIAFSSSTEKWSKTEKEPLKKQRALARKKSPIRR